MSTMIKAEHLTFRYPDEPADHPPVLDDINLEIAAGSFVAILGHNGSGKSTFAKHCNALLTPTQGKLWVDGLDTSDPDNLLAIRGTVGMVFQNPDNQIVASVVEEDVAFGPENIVLDEAPAMLDPVGRRETVDTIRTLNEKFGITVILITHHMDEAAQAQRLIVMADGHIIDDGAPTEVFQHVDTLRNAGLAVPETVGLLYELRKEGLNVPLDAISDEACAAVLAGLLR